MQLASAGTYIRNLFAPVLLCCGGLSNTAYAEPLPQPLTLEYALSLLDEEHPELLQARARMLSADARREASEALDDISVTLEARARWVQPPTAYSSDVEDDHKGSLFVRKSLYDFGRSSAQQLATRSEAEAQGIRYQTQRDLRRIAIIKAFFDVLLADQQNFRDNEELAITYIALDRLRNRQELGQSSDIEVLEQESMYQQVRNRIINSEARQRLSRSRLANLLNRPGELPSELATPGMGDVVREPPEYEVLLESAIQNNLGLQALRLELEAAQQKVKSARSDASPRLDAELEASSYSRETGTSDKWRAGITLTVPIYNGSRVDASVAAAQAEVTRIQAALEQARFDLRQNILERWYEIKQLLRQREQAQSELDYRELYLDRSRANYEMEVQADLGDAMVRLSDAQLGLLQNRLDTVLAWEQLRALVGIDMALLEQMATE